MKLRFVLVLLVSLILISPSQTNAQSGFGSQDKLNAQEKPSAAETVENLKLQLIEVQAQEEALQQRAQQLDEEMKPDNIARSLAGIGSTRPEELREQRRRQLEAQKVSVIAQLGQVTAQRQRLESAISAAELEAYHQSANGAVIQNTMLTTISALGLRWIVFIAIVGIAAIGFTMYALFRIRMRRLSAIGRS